MPESALLRNALSGFVAALVSVSAFGQVTSVDSSPAASNPPKLIGKKWADIDYGPAKKFSVEVSKENIAYKGLAVRLDPGQGGISSGSEFMIFDTETLRWAGGWTGEGFVDWRGIALNGEHEIHPSRVGDLVFHNPVAPGWGHPGDGRFDDERVVVHAEHAPLHAALELHGSLDPEPFSVTDSLPVPSSSRTV